MIGSGRKPSTRIALPMVTAYMSHTSYIKSSTFCYFEFCVKKTNTDEYDPLRYSVIVDALFSSGHCYLLKILQSGTSRLSVGIFHRGLFPVNPGGNIIAFLKDEGTAG